MDSKPFVIFSYSGRFAHFLKAESSASALSYPVPPRTVLLGLVGAVMGLPKDTPQLELNGAMFAITSNPNPQTHWHRAKFRKEIPTPLPKVVNVKMKGSDKPELATLIKQEWLIEPHYEIIAALPETYHSDFVERLRTKSWHFSPYLGLSEMNADLNFISEATGVAIREKQTLRCQSIVPQDSVKIDGGEIEKYLKESRESLKIQVLRMPYDVSEDRVFRHRNYLMERHGRPIPVLTSKAWSITTKTLNTFPIMFL
jgi:CRISPR-associated protein Cas5h